MVTWYTDIKEWEIEVSGASTHNTPDNTINVDDFIPNNEEDILNF